MTAFPVSCVENIRDDATVSVVMPFRASDERIDALERLAFARLDRYLPEEIEIVVVDDGSSIELAQLARRKCQELGYGYIKLDTQHLPMSIGRARNASAVCVKSDYVFFQDIDLMITPRFYQALLNEVAIRNLAAKTDDFLMCGCVYLTEEATREFLSMEEELRFAYFVQKLFENDETRIDKFSTGTSTCLYNRLYFLARGGNDPEFANWGYEDLEFNTRLLSIQNKFPKPRDLFLDYRGFSTITEYRGWKAHYRLMGDMCFPKGLVTFHAWHPVARENAYMGNTKRNWDRFVTCMQQFESARKEPEPLVSADAGRTLVLRRNAFTWNREFAPMLGEVLFAEETDFQDTSDFLNKIELSNIDRVVFHNPYRDQKTIRLYEACRSNDISYIVCERGALRDSMFFDTKGFNADSTSYDECNWNRELTDSERESVLDYIQAERSTDASLEEQGSRIGHQAIRNSLGIDSSTKVIFVPFQRPGDTVITHLCQPIGSFARFLQLVGETAAKLPDDWVIVTKRHPLEDELPAMEGVIPADDANVKDLLDLADFVLLINSGVGVLGMIWEKPVLYAGDAFYAHPDINLQVTSSRDVIEAIKSEFTPNQERTNRFLSYLINEFYSFGRFETRAARMPDGSRITATTNVQFKSLRFPGRKPMNFYTDESPQIGYESILFDRYRNDPEGLEGLHFRPEPKRSKFKTYVSRLPGPVVRIVTYPYGIRRRLRSLACVLKFT